MRNRVKIVIGLVLGLTLAFGTGAVYGSLHGTFQGFPVARVVVDGQEAKGDVPAVILEGRTMVPLRTISETLGADVRWDQDSQTVEIYSETQAPEKEPEPEAREKLTVFIPDPYERPYGLAIFSQPRLDSPAAWRAEHGDRVYLVSKHDNQHWCPDYGVPGGGYIYWEVEHPETGQRGWLNKWWCREFVAQEQPWLLEH